MITGCYNGTMLRWHPLRSPNVRAQLGASLLEVLVALTLIAVVLVSTMQFMAAMQASQRRVEGHTQILRLIEIQLEIYRALTDAPATSLEIDIEEFLADEENPTLDLSTVEDVRLYVDVSSEPQPFLRRLVVRSTYSIIPGDNHEQSIETLIFLP